MKVPFAAAHVFWVPWWDVDHHVYGCPITVTVHARRWNLHVRPFNGFAQGGDRRGELEWRRTREGPSPYEREHAARWVLSDEPPEIWDTVSDVRSCRCRFCVVCLHDEETCRLCPAHRIPARYVRHGVFLRHPWRVHARERNGCRIRWKDTGDVSGD